ncbi:MAG: NADH-quinone oxidoreductase subunit L [Verrucomicrobiota bacterium]|nr:NADH-quinone oxidoreductase subunit L [Verrucomicrobiota bacterium]MEE2813086.1 NADH-quinone oxidoreductase subunit L [Verrucomicrobiota bacterium]
MSKEQVIQYLPLVILLAPLLSAILILLFASKFKRLSAGISVGAVALGLGASIFLFVAESNNVGGSTPVYTWFSIGNAGQNALLPNGPGVNPLVFDISLQNDSLSRLMLLVVTLVGTLVHVFSLVYMREDNGHSRYFGALSFFMFSMLGIVLSANLVMMFIFWELVGVSSYLLISHWFEKPAAADAGKKAFITNRIGDVGFLLGILLVWQQAGSLAFDSLGPVTTLAGLLIFCGAVGKSAQFPLHIWLPDAMEGPTPVSALIHAATMVAAGVYMICRVFVLFTPEALEVIAWTGAVTALLAALIAVQQNDIKRILAYSTLSQLGYMVMAVGCGGPAASMFHLTTHAAFKALLFLGAGAVIYACHHEQNIWKLGNLKNKMGWTSRTFVIGALALSGFPLLSGFFSKDAILMQAYEHQMPLFIIGVFVAFLTAFYMTRCVIVTFFGEARSDHAKEAEEVPGEMVVPLVILALLSIGLGWGFIGLSDFTEGFSKWKDLAAHSDAAHNAAEIAGTLAVAIGLIAGWKIYHCAENDPLPDKLKDAAQWMSDKFYLDELYGFLNQWTQEKLSFAADWFDRWIIAGLGVKGTSGAVDITGCLLRLFQTGNVQTYALLTVIGLLFILALILF